jgi:hypothetical protein
MSKNPKDNADPKQPSSGRQTIRLFVDVPGSGWQAIGGTRGLAIPRDVLHLPEFAGQTVRVALANIRIESRKPSALKKLSIEKWKIGDDGNAEQEDQLQHVVARIKGTVGDSIPRKDDIEAIKGCLGISSA